MRTLILAATLLASTCCPALAAPVLRADVTVRSEVVTVGDLFEDAGLHAEAALFRSPAPGTAGTVDLAAIRAAAAHVGLADFVADGISLVRVARAGIAVDAPLLQDLISTDLRARGIMADGVEADTRFDNLPADLFAPDTGAPVTLLTLRYLPGNNTFAARFAVAGQQAPLDLSGTVELTVEAPFLAVGLPAGTVLTPDHIEMRRTPLRFAESGGLLDLDALTGMALQRPGRAGLALRHGDVAPPQLIGRNDEVTLFLRNGPLTLTVTGKALNAAALGQSVSVLNSLSNKVVSGVARGPGAVEVDTGLLAVASL